MRHCLLAACVSVALASGCGGPSNHPATSAEVEQTVLNDVGELYRMYTLQYKKPPAKLGDFAPLERMSPMGLLALKNGEVVVRFGATLPDTGEEPGKGDADEVLAYKKEVPTSGGQVLMLNRTIRTMSADEFKAAKLAGVDPPTPTRKGATK